MVSGDGVCSEGEVTMSGGYRILEQGEVIQEGDEIDRCADAWRDNAKWEPVHPNSIGDKAPDPRFPSHRIYRRKITNTET